VALTVPCSSATELHTTRDRSGLRHPAIPVSANSIETERVSSMGEAHVKSRWRSFGELDPGHEYLVLASSIPARALSSTWKMFRGASAVRRQLAATDGVVGFSLLAEPLGKNYATLSVWTGREALDGFTAARPHVGIMQELAPAMGPTKFVTWTISGTDGLPTWTDALDRLTRRDLRDP
jgi:hypothetical protein